MESITTASVLDVAAHILGQNGPMPTWKLQKLVCYGQAWSLVWDDVAAAMARRPRKSK